MEEQIQGVVTSPNDTISMIKRHASDSETFRAMCRSFAARKRTKETVTVRALAVRLETEGYIARKEYLQNELYFLAQIGVGTLKKDNNGNIVALTNLKVTLQSVGKAAGEQVANLKNWKKQKRFKKLIPSQKMPDFRETIVKSPKAVIPKKKYTANLIVNIEGNPVNVASFQMAPEELGEFMIEFSQMTKSIRKQV